MAPVIFALLFAADSGLQRERASAEAAVILDVLKERSDALDVLTVDLPTSEVALIRQLSPPLAKILLSEEEAKSAFRPPKRPPRKKAEIGLTVVELSSTHATIMAGQAFFSLSGSRDRFLLEKQHGVWRVIRRDRHVIIA